MTDTIFALATGAGRSAIAIIRLSGPRTEEALAALAGATPAPHVARFSRLRLPASGETLDEGVVIWRPRPKSPTGEDYGELQIHGGRAVIAGLLGALGALPGLRPAAPGEFIRRGFLNGKIDLSQAEAIADLIDADTEFQRRQAMRIAAGAFREKIAHWRETLVHALALVESDLDFSDEADVGALSPQALAARVGPLEADLRAALAIAPASERLRDGFLVLILGPPNAGKSTLLNALARREVAIVSEIAGTTRDMIEQHLDIGGMPVTLVDTAGLRASEDAIEQIGVARTRARAAEADLCLWLSEGGRDAPPADLAQREGAGDLLRVATKSDVYDARGDIVLSAATGAGLDALCARIGESARRRLGDGGSALVIRERHRLCLERAAQCLGAAQAPAVPPELVAENLRLAARALAEIIGAIDVEQLLDEIFSRFCIGK